MKEKKTIRNVLKTKLAKKELAILRRSYDIIGSILIIEIPKLLLKKEKLIGKMLLLLNRNIKTVAKRIGGHKGKYRTQRLKIICGEKNTETLYRENNVLLKLDVEKLYFSPRLATERKRIARLVKKGERVLVMFSGCGPYALVISKNSKAKEIYAVEANRAAHEYAVENIELNKLTNINAIMGDVKKIIPKINKKFDRIVMPLPKGAGNYLDIAVSAAKKGATIHFYAFAKDEEIPVKALNKFSSVLKRKFRIIRQVRCGQVAPREYRVCIDFRVF